jgi:hypothetical protein|nr:MAG TPA: hypothetical protein [Caudoviricetes sp.]
MEYTKKWLDDNRITYTISADGLIYIDGNLKIPSKEDVTLEYLAEVSGSVYVRENATFTAPALVKSGYVYVRENATFTAPALVTIREVCYASEWFGHKVEVYDGMGCVTVSEKTRNGITIRYCRKASFKDSELIGEKYFVVSQGEHNAHGETLDAAMADLMFKTADRDVSKYRNMPLDTVKTPYEWATVYRIITGACQYGTQSFINKQGTLKETYTLQEILALTSGAYGSQKFQQVIKGA